MFDGNLFIYSCKTVFELKNEIWRNKHILLKNYDIVVDVYGVTFTMVFYYLIDLLDCVLLFSCFLILTLSYKLVKLNMYSLFFFNDQSIS